MNHKIYRFLTKWYHDLAILDLKQMNHKNLRSNLSYNSTLYIDIIYAHQGEYTASSLADALAVSKPAVIMKVNELVKEGFLIKKQSQTDKRVFYLFVNEEKLPEFKVYKTQEIALSKALAQNYSPEEISLLEGMLDFIVHHYGENNAS